MPDPHDTAPDTVTLWPLPDQRHLYMIVVGIILGVLLSPAVLGRVAPGAYESMFVGSGDTSALDTAVDALDDFDNDAETRDAVQQGIIDGYNAIGDPGDSVLVGMEEQLTALTNRFADERDERVNAVYAAEGPIALRREQHARKLAGLATTLLLTLVVVFAVESILSPPTAERRQRVVLPPTLGRLVTIRYALIAGWIALMLAQPTALKQANLVVGIVLVTVVLVAGFVPLGKKAQP